MLSLWLSGVSDAGASLHRCGEQYLLGSGFSLRQGTEVDFCFGRQHLKMFFPPLLPDLLPVAGLFPKQANPVQFSAFQLEVFDEGLAKVL